MAAVMVAVGLAGPAEPPVVGAVSAGGVVPQAESVPASAAPAPIAPTSLRKPASRAGQVLH